LDERDTDLKQLINTKFDSVMGALDALRPLHNINTTTDNARRNLASDFHSGTFLPPAGQSVSWRGTQVFPGGVGPDGNLPAGTSAGADNGVEDTAEDDRDESGVNNPYLNNRVTGTSPLRDNKRGQANGNPWCF
jgi:hypothetical protein